MVRLSDGCGMEPEFGAGDFVYVDPDEPATAGRFVAVQPRPEDAVTVRRLATEDGRRVLRTLGPCRAGLSAGRGERDDAPGRDRGCPNRFPSGQRV